MESPTRRRVIVLLVVAAIGGAIYLARRTPHASLTSSSKDDSLGNAPAGAGASGTGPTGTGAPKKTKPPLDVPRVTSLPGSLARPDLLIKPGHWTAAWIEGESTSGDFRGRLASDLRDSGGNLIPLVPQSLGLGVERSVVFPAGDARVAEQWLFAPNDYDRVYETDIYFPQARLTPTPREQLHSKLGGATLSISLAPSAGGFEQYQAAKPTSVLRHHQAVFVVLAGKPHDYRTFGRLQTVLATPSDDTQPVEETAHYRFVAADDPRRAPVASHFAGWTTTALLVWDDYDPNLLTEDQRRALLDWLHWGGRMVISGPDSLDKLAKSFLEPYLPARATGTRRLDAASLAGLDEWTIAGENPVKAKPWPGVELVVNQSSRTLIAGNAGDGPLVVERQTGRGRITATAFRLAQPELLEWRSFDGFLSGCLFGRRPRAWVTDIVGGRKTERPFWREKPRASWYDPRDLSDVRYAVRDSFLGGDVASHPWIGPGNAAWRDDGPVVDVVREYLREEAGIVIPPARIVVGIIGLYLLTLVPLNWFVFRIAGKVEWAWFASPVIALGFTAAVVRIAELDIGFARSQTEVAVVELQPGYGRAHVCRFGAVYNSLGTDYALTSRDASTVILPFAASAKPQQGPETSLRFVRSDPSEDEETSIQLQDFAVESNSTSMYCAEAMRDVGGSLAFELISSDEARLTNDTTIELDDIRLIGSFPARAGSLAPGASIVLKRQEVSPQAHDDAVPRARLQSSLGYLDGDTLRFTASGKTPIDGVASDPAPSQRRQVTVVVGHLAYAVPARARDANIPTQRKLDDLLPATAP